MATYTPPPYFPQGSLSPPDAKRYRKFKLMLAAVVFGLVVLLAALATGIWYLIRWL